MARRGIAAGCVAGAIAISVCGLVKTIDVVRNHQRTHNFSMTVIRLSGSQLHAARVLVGLSREDLAERAGLCRHSIRKWETSSESPFNRRKHPRGLFMGAQGVQKIMGVLEE